MLSHIPEALAALGNLKSLVAALGDAKTNAALREQSVELNFAIIEATNAVIAIQSQYQTLLEEKDQLKKELVKHEDWESEKANYTLTEIYPKVFAFALKPDYAGTAPAHYLCPDCYQNRKTSILQAGRNRIRHKETLNCHPCGLELLLN